MVLAATAALLALQSIPMTQDLQAADKAVAARGAEAKSDPARPMLHFAAPSQWMNDPNGPILFGGWYHVFYQHNPFGEQWEHMHWGHARSKDLVRWEHLPIALGPSKEAGEDHIFSGSCTLDDAGKPILFYTSIGRREPEQWAASPVDGDLIRWRKHPRVLTQPANIHPVAEWRDPFVFRLEGKAHMLVGGGRMGRGTVEFYEATTPDLLNWKHIGAFFTYPDADVGNIECPNLVQLGRRWVLLVSVRGHVEAFVGTIKDRRFVMETRQFLASGSYASQIVQNTKRPLYLAWVRTTNHKAWNGYLTFPMEMSLSRERRVRLNPLRELDSLRGEHNPKELANPCEITATLDNDQPSELKVHGATLSYDPKLHLLRTNHRTALLPGPLRKLRVYVDASAVDVFANDGEAVLCDRLDERGKEELTVQGFQIAETWNLR